MKLGLKESGWIIPAVLIAQAGSAADDAPVEMVVIASRAEVDREAVGGSLSVIGEETINAAEQPLAVHLFRQVPGLAVNGNGSFGTVANIRIRGAEANQTLVFIDGVEANDPASGSAFNFSHLHSFDIERIEVLRGAQSSLYGSEAIGGVINIITASGHEGVSAMAVGEGGSFGTGRVSGTVAGGVADANGRLSVAYFDTKGVSIAPGGSERDGYENLSVSGKSVFTPSETLRFDAAFRFVDSEVQIDQQDFVFGSPTQGLVIDSDDINKAKRLYARGQVSLELFDGAWRHRAGIALTDSDNAFFDRGGFTNGTKGNRLKFDYQTTIERDVGAVSHRLTGAVEIEDLDFKNIGSNPSAPSNQTQSIDQTGLVAEYRINWSDQLFLSAAFRHDRNDRFKDATTVRATAAWTIEPLGWRFHGSVGEGITNPDFFELFGFIPDTFIGNPDLKPEASTSFDIGLESAWFGDRVTADITYFNADLTDEIFTDFFFDPDSGNFLSTARNEDGKSKREGVEIWLQAALTENLRATGSYTWLDATEPDGRVEIRRPEHSANVNMIWKFGNGRGRLNAGLSIIGDRSDAEFIFATPEDRVTLQSYILGRIAASWRLTETVEAFGRIENLFDEDYREVFGFANPGIGAFAGVRIRYGE